MEVLTTSMADNAADLFRICDQEEKGFVTKRDMQRMRKEFPLEPEQLESVFDTLDDDHNGYLTLEEFTEGWDLLIEMSNNYLSYLVVALKLFWQSFRHICRWKNSDERIRPSVQIQFKTKMAHNTKSNFYLTWCNQNKISKMDSLLLPKKNWIMP